MIINRIYTRTGDQGQTRLVNNALVDKAHPLVETYGTVDELTSLIGVALDLGLPAAITPVLQIIQQELFDLGCDLANPIGAPSDGALRILDSQVSRLETWCDDFGADLPKLRSFVLPGGNLAGSYLHLARTICRRAERAAWRAAADYELNPVALQYLNRTSDLLFILARVVTGVEREVLWVPGGERPSP